MPIPRTQKLQFTVMFPRLSQQYCDPIYEVRRDLLTHYPISTNARSDIVALIGQILILALPVTVVR